MKEFDFKHNPDGTITALRLKNHKYVELLTFSIEDIPSLLAGVCRQLPPEVRRYMEQVRGDKISEQAKPEDMEELYKVQREIIDQLTLIVGNLCIIELIATNKAPIFIHDGVKMELSAQVIAKALQTNTKDFFINEYGQEKGISASYNVLKSMFIEENNKPSKLTKWGREALEVLFVDAIANFKMMNGSILH